MSATWLRIFEAKALAEELTEAGHSVSERTAQRWKKGETSPKPQDIRAIRQLVGAILPDTTKEDPPEWAGLMESRIVSEVVASREALYASLAQDLVNAQLGRTPPPDAPPTGRRGRPPGGAGPKPKPTG